MKKAALLSLALAGTVVFSSCGESENSKSANYDTSSGYAASAEYAANEEAEKSDNANESGSIAQVDYKQSEAKAINTQMLVYSCNMSIDVLEFDNAVEQIHDLIKTYNGFIESETYSDGGSSSQWKYADSSKWKSLNVVIRIPSAEYDEFCAATEEIGDMRRKNSSVQNLTTEYSDLKTTLSIYEAKEKRYLDILADIENESDAVAVENELTQIQVEIAKIKTRMNNIENDVAYSYINLDLNEVREYTEKPVVEKEDTFGQRLKETLSGTWSGFLRFLEFLLFVAIRLMPYALFAALIVFIIVMFIKLICRLAAKKAAKNKQQTLRQAPVNAPAPPVSPPANAPETPPATDKNNSGGKPAK